MKCIPCRDGATSATEAEIAEYRRLVPDWKLVNHNGILHLEREFPFRNFVEALAFTNKIGVLAEAEDHHPAILTEWGKVTVRWWTHKIKGLHRNDFILAAKTDSAFAEVS
jgi:4a-hydroxytetrahydrobiopterin dehydratase